MDTKQTKYAVQLITVDESAWPTVGTAYVNKDSSINIYLNPGVGIGGGQKLHLRPWRKKKTDSVPSDTSTTTEQIA